MLDDGYPKWPKPPFLRPEGLNAANPGSNNVNYWQTYEVGRLPEYYNWSIGFQRGIGGNMVVELGYNAQLGRHLATNQISLNQVDPDLFLAQARRLGSVDAARTLFLRDINHADAVAAGFRKPYPNFAGTVRQALRPSRNSIPSPRRPTAATAAVRPPITRSLRNGKSDTRPG